MQTFVSTPFGARALTRDMLASQSAMREFIEKPEAREAVAHKWRLFRSLTEAKRALGLRDRDLSVLHALLSCHPETMLTLPAAGGGIVVFPSNRELAIRAHGMAASTLRRHLAKLVAAGLILRRDSANGKRFARKGPDGALAEAFGFDLTPLLARAGEIERRAEAARAESRAIALLRERITLARRDIAKMIEMGVAERIPADWTALQAGFAALAGHVARNLPRADLEQLAARAAAFAENLRKLLETRPKHTKMSANESQNERHIQDQITDNPDLEPRLQDSDGPQARADARANVQADAPAAAARSRAYPLAMVLDACPDIVDFARGGDISCWRDLLTAAATVRPALGVSPDAWAQAVAVLGEQDAAIVLAAILQRGEEIKSAGGYLRRLTEKARAGAFSLGPLLMARFRSKAAARGGLRASFAASFAAP